MSVAEVKKALATKQQFVQLGDGTLGILPEEWLKKYSLLFRVGEGKTDKLKLSRYHMSVIDDLYENRNEEELTIKLEEKYERIRSFRRSKKCRRRKTCNLFCGHTRWPVFNGSIICRK